MACRRCSECKGATHHWIANGYFYDCKHCEAKGDECETCGGEGCDDCHHEGVVEVARATVAVECVFDEIRLRVGDTRILLSTKQASELSGILVAAVEHSSDWEPTP